jgi:hypothetical protein
VVQLLREFAATDASAEMTAFYPGRGECLVVDEPDIFESGQDRLRDILDL